jgi:hypothetical protein
MGQMATELEETIMKHLITICGGNQSQLDQVLSPDTY